MGVRKVFPIASALLALFSEASSQTTGRMFKNLSLTIYEDVDVLFALVAPKKFLSLPLGTVKASGWLHDQVKPSK